VLSVGRRAERKLDGNGMRNKVPYSDNSRTTYGRTRRPTYNRK